MTPPPTALTAELRERARETVTIWFRTQWPTSTLDPHRDGDYKKLTRAIETALVALHDAVRAEQREQDATITDAGRLRRYAQLTNEGLQEQALSECMAREIGRDSHANGLCSHCLPRAAFYIALRDAARAEQREQDAKIIRKYLVYDSQRAVSWHEIQDCLEAIRAQGETP